jgi:hypothetical protein
MGVTFNVVSVVGNKMSLKKSFTEAGNEKKREK